jgi:hypothetical protein
MIGTRRVEGADARFQCFLGTHGWPTPVIWVRPGEVVRRRDRLVVQVAAGYAQRVATARTGQRGVTPNTGLQPSLLA